MDSYAPGGSVSVRSGGVTAMITLQRAESRNALDETLVTDLSWAFDTAEADPEVRCVVVTGAGRAFCAGAVLDTLIASADGDFESVKRVYEGFLRVLRCPLPTIAAVNGAAVGAGLNLALACDVRLASVEAVFDSRFPQLRLHPGGGHTWLLGKAVGRQAATLMALFGETLDAAEAARLGLVAAVHERADLLPAALALGERLAGMDADFVKQVVLSLREAEQTLEHAGMLERETERQRWSTTQPNFVESTRALQRRISSRTNR